MLEIAKPQNYFKSCEQRIQAACKRVGRPRSSVHLLAVSKGQSPQKIQDLYALGQRDFGENYAEELSTKMRVLKEVCWHFIGQIQSNKIKQIAQAHWVHSLASLKHAKLLAEHTPHERLKVFLQVNLSAEPRRGGVLSADLHALAQAVMQIPKLELKGLMAILPLHPKYPPAYWFQLMQSLQKPQYLELSMGMSDDFEEAIAHEATWIRLGVALFGGKPCLKPQNTLK